MPPRRAGSITDRTPVPATYQGAEPALNCPILQGSHRAGCVVIGGGFTGLSTALHLAQAGRQVTVLEAREIGWGGSGRAFGQVVPYAKHDEADVLRHQLPASQELALSVNNCPVQPPATTIQLRGNPNSPGAPVEPGFPAVLGFALPKIPTPAKDARSSGRTIVDAR